MSWDERSLGRGIKWAGLENLSTTVRIVVLPLDGGRPVMKTRKIYSRKPQEALQLQSGGGLWPIHHCSHLSRIHLYVAYSYDVFQEGDGGGMVFTFLCFDKQLVLQKKLEDLPDMEDKFLNWLNMSRRTLLTRAWNTAGVLVSPNGITRYW
jgi:hypothetical protein